MPKIRNKNDDKITMKFDIPMLNTLIKYILCDCVSKVHISNLNKLINTLDLDSYNYNVDIQERLIVISSLCQAVLEHNMRESDVIRSFIISNHPDFEMGILSNIDLSRNQLNASECKYLSESVSERLQYLYLFKVKDEVTSSFDKLNKGTFTSYYEIVKDLKLQLSQLLVQLQNVSSGTGLMRSFSFTDDNFNELIDQIVTKAKLPSAVLQTGIRQLNAILSPGFQSGRLYCWLGFTGKFKSGLLLNLADQIRKFNPQIQAVENGVRKTILFLTMENSLEETVIRLVDMYSGVDCDIPNMSTEEVIKILRENGNYTFTDEDGIDIDIRFYANLEINTAQVYSIIQELDDNNKKVICLILDYIKRIDSTRPSNGDERLRLSYVAKELKSLAQYFNIPVITAQQINRQGNEIIDAAMRDNKQDLAKLVGSSMVGESWSIVEEADWMGLINLERHISTGELFLTFKRTKIRGKRDVAAVDYFNHPFADVKEIRLATDVDKPQPISVISLATDLESVEEKVAENIVKARPTIGKSLDGARNNDIFRSISLDRMIS